MQCGVWNWMKIWSSHFAGQFNQLSHEPKKFRWLNRTWTHDLCGAGAVLSGAVNTSFVYHKVSSVFFFQFLMQKIKIIFYARSSIFCVLKINFSTTKCFKKLNLFLPFEFIGTLEIDMTRLKVYHLFLRELPNLLV